MKNNGKTSAGFRRYVNRLGHWLSRDYILRDQIQAMVEEKEEECKSNFWAVLRKIKYMLREKGSTN